MNAIVEAKQVSLPSPIDQGLYGSLRYYFNSLGIEGDRRALPADRAPSERVRQALSDRRDLVNQWLRSCGEKHALAEVTAIFGTMSMRTGSASDMRAMMVIYAKDLGDLPSFALTRACADFRQGRAGDGHWVPTAAEIRAVAQRYVADLAKEGREITMVLAARIQAPPASPERKAALAASVAETLRQLSAFSAQAEAEDREKRAARHRFFAARDKAAAPPTAIMEMVGRNIEAGNAHALAEVSNTKGNA